LLRAVNENEKYLEKLRVENDFKTAHLNNLKIENDNDETSKSSPNSQEVVHLHDEIQTLEKELTLINSRKKNVGVVFDQVRGWSNRISAKLNQQISDQIETPRSRETLSTDDSVSVGEVFARINKTVCEQLRLIIAQNQHLGQKNTSEEIEVGNCTQMMMENQHIDFATEEFIEKNIRVRPNSGMTTGEKDEQRSELLKNAAILGTHL
jgi:hypothetical protein